MKGHDSIVRLLIEQRVDVNAADKKGNRVLVNAARNGHETTSYGKNSSRKLSNRECGHNTGGGDSGKGNQFKHIL